MQRQKIVRITTVPLSLEKLLEGQLSFMSEYYDMVAISSEKERLLHYGESEGVQTYHVPLTRKITPLKDIRAVYKIYRFLKQSKPSIVHSHTPKAGVVGMMAAYFAGVPHRLHTVAGLPLLETKGLKRMILNAVEKLTYRFATIVYPNSEGLKQIILSKKFTTNSKLRVLGNGSSNGIDTTFFSSERYTVAENLQKRESLKINTTDVVFVFVGRIVGDKGINEMVEAFVSLQQQQQNCTLLLVGPFEEALDPVSETTKNTIETHHKIVWVGFQQDVRSFLALSDVFVFPSYREGFPNVVMQAGAMGLPCIVSNINGCNEIIVDDINGSIIEVKNTPMLHDAMKKMILNKQLREQFQQQARPMIVKRYERKYMWQLILNQYNQLTQKHTH